MGEERAEGAKTGAPMTMEWGGEVESTRPMDWRKTSERPIVLEWLGESIQQGSPKTPEWKGRIAETNTGEWWLRVTECRVETGKGGE